MVDEFKDAYKVASEVDDMVIGGIAEAKEDKQLIPPTKRVKFFIKSVKNFATDKTMAPRDWRFFSLELYLDEGITDISSGKVLYKNKNMYQNVPYFANPAKYDFDKPFFAKKSYLIPLQQICKAVGLEMDKVTPKSFTDACTGKFILGDIVQVAETVKVQNTENGQWERKKTGDFLNEVKNFAACSNDLQ